MKGQKKKAMWAKKRAANAEARAAEKKANTARAYRKPKFTELKPKESKYVITEGMKRIAEAPSADGLARVGVRRKDPKLAMSREEYDEREAAAQKAIARKKRQVAPLYNKGGLQFVGDDAPPEIVKNLGRKV